MNVKVLLLTLVLIASSVYMTGMRISALVEARSRRQSGPLDEAEKLTARLIALYKQGKFSEALPAAQQALEIRRKALRNDDPLVASALRNLASLYLALNDYRKAEPLYQERLSISEKLLGPDSPKLCPELEELGWCNYGMANLSKAEDLFQRSLTISEKAFGPESDQVASSALNLGRFLEKSGRVVKALPIYERVLSIREKNQGPASIEVATALDRCACMKVQMDDDKGAAELRKRADIIRDNQPNKPKRGKPLSGRAIFRAEPAYPQNARQTHMAGTVLVEVHIDKDGKVLSAKPICGPDIFSVAALEAAKKWRFEQTKLNGVPVEVIGTLTFNFRL